MYNRRYEKVFRMLRQETAGYAIGNRPPWGSCVMELKNGAGRLSLTVQGLRPRGGGYGVYLLAGEESIFCGVLSPDSRSGHGTWQWDFAPDAVGEGKTAEEFRTVLLVAEDGGGSDSVVLTADFGEKQMWKGVFRPRAKAQPAKTQLQAEPESPAEPAEPQAEISLQAAEACPAAMRDSLPHTGGYHGSFQGLLARFRQELEELEETGILSETETAAIRSAGESPIVTEAKEAEAAEAPAEPPAEEAEPPAETAHSASGDTVADNPQTASPFCGNRELEPFAAGEAWKCLLLEEMTLLSQIPLRWQRAFFFLLPYRRYHHLILREGDTGVWLGVPGEYRAAEEAEAAAFGFTEFRRVDGDWGYWIAFLERDA